MQLTSRPTATVTKTATNVYHMYDILYSSYTPPLQKETVTELFFFYNDITENSLRELVAVGFRGLRHFEAVLIRHHVCDVRELGVRVHVCS